MIYIIIPTYNEAGNVEKLITEISQLDLPRYRILFVDDNSPDGTGQIIEKIAQNSDEVEIIHNRSKVGLGKAYLKGFNYIAKDKPETIITMDADFSHPPSAILDMLKKLSEYDYVVGSRYVKGGRLHYPFQRKVISKGGVLLARLLLGIEVRDCTAAYRCFNLKVLKSILNHQFSDYADGYIFQVEVNYLVQKEGYRVTEVPIIFNDRINGESKLAASNEMLKGMLMLFKLKLQSK